MSWQRIKTVIVHTGYHLRYSLEAWIDMFWFSITDILIFGLISIFFAKTGGGEVQFLLLGLLLWEVVRVGQYSVAVGAMWEVWSKSLSSFFVSPLTFQEYLTGQIISAFFKALAAFFITAFLSAILYHFSVLTLGLMLPIYIVGHLVFAWALGMLALGLIFKYGNDIQALSWSLVFLFQPIGAFFYPVSVLPVGIRWIAYLFPPAYINEAARFQLIEGIVHWQYLGIALLLNVFYFLAGYLFVKKMFYGSIESGRFVRMEA